VTKLYSLPRNVPPKQFGFYRTGKTEKRGNVLEREHTFLAVGSRSPGNPTYPRS
jgi:hypothetical protein